MSKPFEFKPEDFNKVFEDFNVFELEVSKAVEIANAKLKEWLEASPTVYVSEQELKTLHFAEPVGSTHKAKIVCIEPCGSDD